MHPVRVKNSGYRIVKDHNLCVTMAVSVDQQKTAPDMTLEHPHPAHQKPRPQLFNLNRWLRTTSR